MTKEIPKTIKIRDNEGNEFIQQVIHEWCPYYCQKCKKVGHLCKMSNKAANISEQEKVNRNQDSLRKENAINESNGEVFMMEKTQTSTPNLLCVEEDSEGWTTVPGRKTVRKESDHNKPRK